MVSGKQKHVLVAVLDWGLGHATRCIPIINCLLVCDCKVSIAGNGASLVLLKQEFPQLTFHELTSYKITYSSNGFFFPFLLFQSPRIFNAIRTEKKQIEKLVIGNRVDAVISDNRYGCYSEKVPSVLITHQLNIQLPVSLSWMKWIVDYMNLRLIKKFGSCWVPDFPDRRLTGKLSESKKLKARFIGALSRFQPDNTIQERDLVVGIISGPEPQREIFERLLIKEFRKLDQPCLIIRGLPGNMPEETKVGGLTLISHASARNLERVVSKAGIIIARSGYSTIMDLQALGKKQVIFIPTPGQTEQEYLAAELEKSKIVFTQSQDQFNAWIAIQKAKAYSGFDARQHRTNLLHEAIDDLLHLI